MSFDLSALDTRSPATPAPSGRRAIARAPAPDGIARPWWAARTANANGGGPLGGLFGTGGSTNGSGGMVSGLITALQQLVGALLNQRQNPGQTFPQAPGQGPSQQPWQGPWQIPGQTPAPWQNGVPGGPMQKFTDVDVSSTGDPHIAEVGTRAGRNGDKRSTRTGIA